MKDLQLKYKIRIVTGGAEGIVKVFATEGAIPVIIGRNTAENQKVVTYVKAAGGSISGSGSKDQRVTSTPFSLSSALQWL